LEQDKQGWFKEKSWKSW